VVAAIVYDKHGADARKDPFWGHVIDVRDLQRQETFALPRKHSLRVPREFVRPPTSHGWTFGAVHVQEHSLVPSKTPRPQGYPEQRPLHGSVLQVHLELVHTAFPSTTKNQGVHVHHWEGGL
jgi:hypothetical protein